MTTSDTTSLALAAAANAVAVVVALGMWRRARRRGGAVRARHPSVQPPMSVDLVPGVDGCSLRVDVRRGAPSLSLDIVSFRRPEPDASWDSVPIVDPVLVVPGAPVTLSTTLPRWTDAVDVVIAWTAHHPTGELQDSRLLRVPTAPAAPGAPSTSGALGGRLALALVVLLAGSMLLVARSAAIDDSPEQRSPAPDTPEQVPPPRNSTTAAPLGTPPPPTEPPTPIDPPVTVVVGTVEPVRTSTDTSTDASSTSTSTSTSTPTESPQVLLDARLGPCRFADDCLVVGFRIEGFTTSPQEYVCEFNDGSRFTFRFDSGGVDDACATGNTDAAITVEVDGVRSTTATRADVPSG